ncbi:ANTAR domain-containing protein [Blastococcus sp. SYSU DS0617]
MREPLGVHDDEAARLRSELGIVHEHVTQLEAALLSSRRIGIAMGIVMERHRLTEEQAFGVLVRLSQDGNVKVRDIAARIVETGQLPSA